MSTVRVNITDEDGVLLDSFLVTPLNPDGVTSNTDMTPAQTATEVRGLLDFKFEVEEE